MTHKEQVPGRSRGRGVREKYVRREVQGKEARGREAAAIPIHWMVNDIFEKKNGT